MASRDKKPSKPSSSIADGIRTLSDLTATQMAINDSDNDSNGPQEYYTGGEKSSICSCTTCCKAQDKLAKEIVALSKLKYTLLMESHAQEKELFRFKVENMEYDQKIEGNKIRQEDERLRLEAEKLEIARREANEKVERDQLERDERIMMIDAQAMLAEEIVALSKLKYTLLEESRAQEKELFRLKVEKMEYDQEREEKKIGQENERLRLEAERLRLEAEKLKLTQREANERTERDQLEREEQIMTVNMLNLYGLQTKSFEQRQKEIMKRFY